MIRSAVYLLAAAWLLAALPASAADFRVVAYVVGGEPPPQIDPTKLTHINFAFGKIEDGKVVLPHPGVAANLAYLRSLKAKNPQLKVLLSVGGWEAEGFSDAAVSAASRAAFAASIVALLRAHSLDGVDLDWEYPGQGVAGIKSRPQDKQNFTALLKTVREQLDAASPDRRFLLTIASADREYFD